MTTNILETKTIGKRAGINMDGKPVGYAVRIAPDRWTVFADLYDADGNYLRPYTAVGQRDPQAAAEHLRDVIIAVRGGAR